MLWKDTWAFQATGCSLLYVLMYICHTLKETKVSHLLGWLFVNLQVLLL